VHLLRATSLIDRGKNVISLKITLLVTFRLSYSKLFLFRPAFTENRVSLLQNIERKGAKNVNSLISLFRDFVVKLF
jgi:hypothetical protein